MAKREMWARSVPDAIAVDGDTVNLEETRTVVELTVTMTGRVVIEVDDLRRFLTEAGYEREDPDV